MGGVINPMTTPPAIIEMMPLVLVCTVHVCMCAYVYCMVVCMQCVVCVCLEGCSVFLI